MNIFSPAMSCIATALYWEASQQLEGRDSCGPALLSQER